jgi:hypothetical protein
MRKIANVFFLSSIVLLLAGVTAFGQAPSTMIYQGRLTDLSGEPITEVETVVFLIYSHPTVGNALWGETLSVAPDIQGVFTVELGATHALTGTLFDGDKLYLGLTVGTDEEMSPRHLLSATPYAISSGQIPDASVTTAKLVDGAVTAGKIAGDAVDSSKVIPGGINSGDLLDEPGIDFVRSLPPNTFRAIPAGTTALDSIKVTVPAAGFVNVQANANIGIDHINGILDQLIIQVTADPDTIVANDYGLAMIMVPPEMPTSSQYVLPVDAHRPFDVPAAGEYTFYVNAKMLAGSGDFDSFFNLQLTAMYLPTSYGSAALAPARPNGKPATDGDENTGKEDKKSD